MGIFKAGARAAQNTVRNEVIAGARGTGFGGLVKAEKDLIARKAWSAANLERLSAQSSVYPPREPLSIGPTRSAHANTGMYQYGNGSNRTEPINTSSYMKKDRSRSDVLKRYNSMYKNGNSMWNRTASGARSIFNGAHAGDFQSGLRNAAISGGTGMMLGAGTGLMGNIMTGGALSETDPHMVRNAMFMGATAGAFGAARAGLGSMVRSQNHNITPLMRRYAAKTVGVMDSKATKMALFAAGLAGGGEGHLTRSFQSTNFSQQ